MYKRQSLAVADAALAVGFVVTAGALDRTSRRADRRPSADGKKRVVALSLAVFFFYAGVAAGTGAWAFSYLTDGRGIGTTVAGIAVAGYWAALTLARISLGVLGDRLNADRTLTASGVATVATLLVFWMAPIPWLTVVALIASGLAHGSIFPLEMVLTARRFGAAYTPWAVGYEIAAANVGIALLSGGMGLLVVRWGVGAVAPALVVIALFLLAALEVLRVRSVTHQVASA